MNSTQGRVRGGRRRRVAAQTLPTKPGEFRQLEEISVSHLDDKPRVQSDVQSSGQTVNTGIETKSEQLVDVVRTEKKVEHSKPTEYQNVDNVLLRAVNNPEFVPKTSSVLALAVNAPEFVPGQTFHKHEETAEERLSKIQCFLNDKIKQLMDDPGLLDEISIFMGSYLSIAIKVKNNMRKLSDLLFEKCTSAQNVQYIGTRLANYLDKYLVPKTKVVSFRKVFLKRCQNENSRFKEEIRTNPERACIVAVFFGELLMNYKTKQGETVKIFVPVVSNIIKQLLNCPDRKLLICAGKLLKLTGRTLHQDDELFETVTQLANDPHVDRKVQMLFSRVCELRRTSWGRQKIPLTVTYTDVNTHGAQGYSMYFPNMDGISEEQFSELPVVAEEEWNEYLTDKELSFEEQTKSIAVEQYGYYFPYAIEDNWSNEDNFDDDFETFLQGK